MAGSLNEHNVSARTEDLKYLLISNVNVSNFVSVKLSDHSNYPIWKAQMRCLIESQELLHLIEAEIQMKGDGDNVMIKKYDNLVKGWIFGSMNENVLKNIIQIETAIEVWIQLESFFGTPKTGIEGDSWNAQTEDLKYTQASNVNVSNFVSVKLLGRINYKIWKAQMHCLIESQVLLHIIDARHPFPVDKGFHMISQYDKLVKGWIFGTLTDEVLKQFYGYETAGFIWITLESRFKNPPAIIIDGDKEVGFVFGIESIKKELYEAAVEGCWWKVKSILKTHKNAATEAITPNGNTILHVSVEMGNNYFVEKLLGFLEDPEDIEKKNLNGWTALHMAAAIGNIDAAQLLVQKRKELLVIPDSEERAPFNIAYANQKLSLYAYLLKSTLPYSDDHDEFALYAAILAKQYDLTETLLKNFSNFTAYHELILVAVTITFPSDLTFMESFIYPSFHNVYQKTLMRGSLLFQSNFLDICFDDILRVVKICNNTCCNWLGKNSIILLVPIATLYPIYQLICILILMLRLTFSLLYFLLWKSLAVIVHPIKNIEKKKKEYRQAKKNLSIICDLMGTSSHRYSNSLFQAIVQDTYEVVDEILFRSPAAIDCMDDKGYNLIQSVIINRSEKVYKLIYHIIERTKSYRDITHSSNNNLVHLAGRLSPSFVLDRTTGAALQLQQELLWFEVYMSHRCQEVKKLISPFELMQKNNYDETPAMVFTKEHKDLMKQGESWMKTTAESCSITAALIITIVFAAAITVPGGSNQESGIPLFRKKIAFAVFAVSNAFSLFTATTALLLFLSILTARYSEKDFKVSLPRRLILGLLTLFISTTAMMVAFGAILFLVICDERPWMLAPICAFACLPISVIVTIKLPLLVDLIQSTFSPIFSKQGYLDSCKINRRNTLFK